MRPGDSRDLASGLARLEATICTRCGQSCWQWPGGSTITGGPLLFDHAGDADQDGSPMLLLHGCCHEDQEPDHEDAD